MNEKEQIKMSPCSKTAEESILGSILLDETSFDKVSPWIKKNDAFYFTESKMAWQAIKELRKEKVPIDLVTLDNKCKDLFPKESLAYYLSGILESTPTAANIENHGRIVWERYVQRQAIKLSSILTNRGFADYTSVSSTVSDQIRILEELRNLQPDRSRRVDLIVKEAIELIKKGNNIIPFGMFALDRPAGGMTRSEVTVLGGRPGHGKTTLMLNVLKSLVEQGRKIVLFNREMSNTEMIRKLIILESQNLSYSELRSGTLRDDSKRLEKIEEKISEKYKDVRMYDDVRNLDDAMSEISRHKPDVVIDDYIQLIMIPNNADRRFQIENIMLEYKWICKKENCSAFVLSQLNREIERRIDPYPRMSDYAESGVIEQTVETALFIFYGYNFDHQEYDMYETEIIASKSRYGTVGGFKVGFNGDKCKFYDTKNKAREDSIKELSDNWLE